MLHNKWCLIYEFIDNGLSDQKLAMLNTDGFLPLSEEEFNKTTMQPTDKSLGETETAR